MSGDIRGYYRDFEDYGAIYGAGFWMQYRREALGLLAPGLPRSPGLRVLDLGGGAMLSLSGLRADPRVAAYVVVDLVIRLPKGLLKVEAVESDVLSYLKAYQGPPFDAVVLFGVLEYLSPADAAEVLRLLAPRLAERGQALVHDPNVRAEAYTARGAGAQRTVELPALLPGSGLVLVERRDYHLPWLRRVYAKLGLKAPVLLRAGLALEWLLGGGMDSLYLLAREDDAQLKP